MFYGKDSNSLWEIFIVCFYGVYSLCYSSNCLFMGSFIKYL